jgi:hypothetical protein
MTVFYLKTLCKVLTLLENALVKVSNLLVSGTEKRLKHLKKKEQNLITVIDELNTELISTQNEIAVTENYLDSKSIEIGD